MRQYSWRIILVFWLAVLAAPLGAPVQAAQTSGVWSPQRRIPDYGDESRPPFLVADRSRNVLVFDTQPDGNQVQAIYFRRWSLEHGWSPPVDIFLSPLPGAPVIEGITIDQNEIVHLIFFAGNEVSGNIYYSSAPAARADQPQAWSEPVIVGENGLGLGAAMAGDGKEGLYIIYGGKDKGLGLYATYSTNHGNTWSGPQLVSLMHDTGLIPNGTQAIVDSHNRLQVVWSEVNAAGIDQAVYSIHLSSDLLHWSQPFVLANRQATQAYKTAWPSIVDYQGTLMVIYQDSNPATRWMRQSTDGGDTWTDPVRPWPHVGEYSQADLLVDSSNTLHIILGNRNGECCHGMWHGIWMGSYWGALEPIVMGPKTLQFDPSAPRSVISQGNVLLATWWTDTGGGPRNGAWYSYAVLNSPELPVEPSGAGSGVSAPTSDPALSQAAPPASPVPPIQSPAVQTTPAANPAFQARPSSDSPLTPLVVGLAPVVLLVLAVVIYRSKSN